MDFRTYCLPKRGNTPDEWEDAFAANPDTGRIALADGVTESAFAKSWAQSLVNRFVEAADCGPADWSAWLPALQEQWSASFHGRELPWYAEEQLRRGAFATFLGLVLNTSHEASWKWHAVAVGDTCLFHTRGKDLLDAFPIAESNKFGTLPKLLGSRSPVKEVSEKRALSTESHGQADDRLWMMTDALAQWCLAEQEAGRAPWPEMEWLLGPNGTDERFASWIDDLRDAKQMHNDDVTLLILCL